MSKDMRQETLDVRFFMLGFKFFLGLPPLFRKSRCAPNAQHRGRAARCNSPCQKAVRLKYKKELPLVALFV